MKNRLFVYSALIIFAGLFCFFAASVYITHSNNLRIAKDTVVEITSIYAGLYDAAAVSSFDYATGDTRVTVISADGRVLADSRPLAVEAMENHLTRPEIQAAANGAPAAYVRHSDTLGVDYMYYAVKADNANGAVFIRCAIPIAKIEVYLFQSLPLLIVLLLAVTLLSFAFSRGMINRITKPFQSVASQLRLLSAGEEAYTLPEPIAGSYEEIDAIVHGIDEISQILQRSITALRDEKTKLDYVMGNIKDALFVLDECGHISLINAAALGIFHVNMEIIGKSLHYLTNERTLVDAVTNCVTQAQDALFELTINGSIFLTSVKRLPDTILTMVVLSDVTENRENAKRREEFFANASHELKTPLTAIKGFNELTAIHNRDEKINKYIGNITRETNRMLSLIEDMLKLSEIESAKITNPEPVSLAETVREAHEALLTAITKKSIYFTLDGDAIIPAEPGHVYELVKNLLENAVRYTNQGGRVSVTIESNQQATRLFVLDDGIGISSEEQARVFERFYRVEKSRSSRNGGTGLGLSIVKHTCALYGWNLSLTSKLGIGTEITVTFEEKKNAM